VKLLRWEQVRENGGVDSPLRHYLTVYLQIVTGDLIASGVSFTFDCPV
jgi:hypothetical protein